MNSMNRRQFLGATAAVAAGAVWGKPTAAAFGPPGSQPTASAPARPNILFIMTDQQHWRMLSGFGNPWVKTPAMDSLAAAGTRFDCAYTTFPQCVPARVSLVTGQMPSHFGVQQNASTIAAPYVARIDHTLTLGALFRTAGYDTQYGGKVHLPRELAGEPGPQHREGVSGIGFNLLSSDWGAKMAEDCAAYLRQKHEKPFFLFASFIEPHGICGVNSKLVDQAGKPVPDWSPGFREGPKPIWPRGLAAEEMFGKLCPPLPGNRDLPNDEPEPAAVQEYRKFQQLTAEQWRFQEYAYARLVERVDGQIAVLLQALRETGQEDSTLIVFTSDHGDMNGAHQLANKRALYEEATRVPFIVSRKGVTKPGTIDAKNLVSTGLDVLPTLCDYAGIQPPGGLPGRSVRNLAEGRPVPDWRNEVAIELSRGRGLRTERFKYMSYAGGGEQFFDLASDPGELKDLKNDPGHQAILADHRQRLERWRRKIGDDLKLQADGREREN